MTRSLDKFLDGMTPMGLARVRMAWGNDRPFGFVEFRSHHPENSIPKDEKFDLLSQTFAARGLFLTPEPGDYGRPRTTDAILPSLYRVQMRPRTHTEESPSNKLTLWTPDHSAAGTAGGRNALAFVEETQFASDVLATPVQPVTVPGVKNGHEAQVPMLRLADGAIDATVLLSNNGVPPRRFMTYLGIDRKKASLLGAGRIDVADAVHWPVTISPLGLEFDAALPDPTRGFGGDGADTDVIIARFRLETVAGVSPAASTASDKTPKRADYVLRLIGRSRKLEEDRSVDSLRAAGTRLRQALGSLLSQQSPALFRLDDRGEVPPLVWPLNHVKAGSKQVLSFVPTPGAEQEPLVLIDTAATDLRMRTRTDMEGAEEGLARIYASEIAWRRTEKRFEIHVRAGGGAALDDSYALKFKHKIDKDKSEWTTDLEGTIEDTEVHLAETALAERLTALYRETNAIGPDAQAPYAFLATRTGWLQYPLQIAKTENGTEADASGNADKGSDETANPDKPRQAMSGRIVFAVPAPGMKIERGLSIEDAERLDVTIGWDRMAPATTITLQTGQSSGQFLGFLFAAETSPTGTEALPTWVRGDASARELPLWFGSRGARSGSFTWKKGTDEQSWTLDLDLPNHDPLRPALAWVKPGRHPFVTNFPLSRTVMSSPQPSLTRGLLPFQVKTQIRLHFASAQGKPLPENELPVIHQTNGAVLPGPRFEAPDPGAGRYVQSLLLPTLHGVEFDLDTKAAAETWGYRAALRYDLPLLDELFAWSDPPPPKAEQSGAETDALPEPPAVTALTPIALAETWRASEKRMRLTWTQDALIKKDHPVVASPGNASEVTFGAIVKPYILLAPVAVSLSEDHLFGDLAVPGQPEGLAGAAVGLGGYLEDDDDILAYDIDAQGKLTAGGDQVTVTGYAADLYRRNTGGALVDARGAGWAEKPAEPGQRGVSLQSARSGAADSFSLLTTPDTETVDADGLRFGFYCRDLPVRGDNAGGFLFEGFDTGGDKSKARNPVEGARGQTGQAFDEAAFLQGLHEWRCFPLQEDIGKDQPDLLGSYQIPVGPYQFRPLRLARALFDVKGRPTQIQVLGSLVYQPRSKDTGKDFAFDADRVYDRDDLFLMDAARSGKNWKATFKASMLADDAGKDIQIKPREPANVTFRRRLTGAASSAFRFQEDVDCEIDIGFNNDSKLSEETAGIRCRLFGHRFERKASTVTRAPGSDVLTLTFDGFIESPDARAGLRDAKLVVTLRNDAAPDTIDLQGRLEVWTPPGEDATPSARALLSCTKDKFRWLDTGVDLGDGKAGIAVVIDHASGVVRLSVENLVLSKAAQPLFNLGFQDDAKITGRLTGVFADADGLDLATGHLHIEMRADGADKKVIRHQMLFSPGSAENDIFLTWKSDAEPCPIRWPVGENAVRLSDDGPSLKEIAKGPLDPDVPGGPKDGSSRRILTIEPGGPELLHRVQLILNSHRIPADLLLRDAENGRLRPRRTIRLMAATRHWLGDPDSKGEKREVSWWSLDHIGITSAAAMLAEVATRAFVARQSHNPRHSNKLAERLLYRGDKVASAPDGRWPEGVAALSGDNVAGFHDPAMVQHLWSNLLEKPDTVILGHGATVLPQADAGGRGVWGQVAMLPWVMGLDPKTRLQSPAAPRQWRISTADSWAAHAMTLRTDISPAGLDTSMTQAAFTEVARRGGLGGDPARLIPVEAAFFEPLTDGKAHPIGDDLHAEAPYFLRALLALGARWRAGIGNWRVETMIPRPSASWPEALVILPTGGDPALRRISLQPATRQHQPGQSLTVPADLVVLSRDSAVRLSAYREIVADVADASSQSQRADLSDMATRKTRDALAAIRVVRRPGKTTALLAQSVARKPDPLDRPGPTLTRRAADIVASPALGWPYAPDGAPGTALPPLEAIIGPDRAHQAPSAGFSGRSQRLRWPVHALGADSAVQSVFASFGQHVVYDRSDAAFDFDGPPARHLSPNATRRRAPEPALTQAALQAPQTAEGTRAPFLPEPLTAPVIDRLQIGRRPGVIEISTSSLTTTGRKDKRTRLLDEGWPGMGQPADGGPVVAHQLRTPRSPVLPPDPAPNHLGQRRRTFLSLADRAGEVLKSFRAFDGVRDVIRLAKTLEKNETGYWRITVKGQPPQMLGPRWQGELRVRLEGIFAKGLTSTAEEKDPTAVLGLTDNDLTHQMIAVLDIGDTGVPAARITRMAEDPQTITLTFGDVEALQTRLSQASANTPMQVTLKFPGASAGSAEVKTLVPAPTVEMLLPLALDPGRRRVVRTRQVTVAFGDPSYDRILASPTSNAPLLIGDTTWRLAIDRQEYNRDNLLYLAFGPIDPITDLFDGKMDDVNGTASFMRIPAVRGDGAPVPAQRLWARVATGASGTSPTVALPDLPIRSHRAYQLRLTDLLDETQQTAPLQPGDAVQITVALDSGKVLIVQSRIVAAPVIAPPPSVFSVIERVEETDMGRQATTRLHAPSTLPTRVEMPNLLGDLARGHVRREALFVWYYATPASPVYADFSEAMLEVLKLDRSGGAQLPEDQKG